MQKLRSSKNIYVRFRIELNFVFPFSCSPHTTCRQRNKTTLHFIVHFWIQRTLTHTLFIVKLHKARKWTFIHSFELMVLSFLDLIIEPFEVTEASHFRSVFTITEKKQRKLKIVLSKELHNAHYVHYTLSSSCPTTIHIYRFDCIMLWHCCKLY